MTGGRQVLAELLRGKQAAAIGLRRLGFCSRKVPSVPAGKIMLLSPGSHIVA